ncbi:hypothetical protein BDW59DRAFT_164537 [Aspergillus cavernicola]|uniref:Zn(2)-C6 fungal-type domain-containing protein n=1 Tax=Aspergillus cavernicola TaxID=176166 RepID=A0ABR4I1H1_9EURO
MNCVKACTPCLDDGCVCDGNPQGCLPCLRNGFICTKDFRDCPIILQPGWSDEDLARTSSVISSTQIAHDHASLIQSVSDFYQVLVDMQYLQDDEIIQPPQLTLPPLVEASYTPDTVALLRQLPHLRTSALEITPSETQPFPYLNLDELDTIPHHNNPRDPLDHMQEEDWTIPPWTFFISRPAPRKYVRFPYCRIYDTRSKTLGRWSETLLLGNNPFLLDARPPEEVIGAWISAFRSLRWIPSLLREERIIHEIPASLGTDNNNNIPPWEKNNHNIYWAQRAIYEDCGWPDRLRPEELTRRRMEWIELVGRSSRSAYDLRAFYHRAAGDHAM